MNRSFFKALEIIGGQTRMAEALTKECGRKIMQSHVYSWLRRNKSGVPAEFCPVIERLTGIPKEKIRPDVRWG